MTVYDFDYNYLNSLPVCLKKKKQKKEEGKKKRKTVEEKYVNEILAFDIEASNLDDIEQAVMYIWAMQIGDRFTIYGRSWDEFIYFMHNASEVLGDKKLVIYVHNLSYEFSFLQGLYDFSADEVFATDAHKVIKCSMLGNIEFRCSYFLTNLSLAKFSKQMGVENQKLDGKEFNYSKKRYPWTELSDFERAYMTNDVKGLVQALKKKFELTGDDITTIPLTATGFVRRDIRKAMEPLRWDLIKMYPTEEVYKLLREAYRGGNTMANRYIADLIIENVSSADMVSSYPNTLLCFSYPMGPFKKDLNLTIKNVRKLKSAFVARFGFGNLRLKDPNCPCPYISTSKCRKLDTSDKEKVKIWNGRVLKADFLETTLTDIDFKIIDELYEWDTYYIRNLYTAPYRPLPKELKEVILHYYREKTRLKGTKEGDPDYPYYCAVKALLNAIYGCCVEDPCKTEIEFIDGEFEDKPCSSIEKRLNGQKWQAPVLYQWGVWCSAWARFTLQEGINLVGEDFCYCDTDSVKYQGKHDFGKLNALAELRAEQQKAYAYDQHGEVHYIGVWEDEGYELPNRFATMGAKKYVLETPDKELHITISGVGKGGGKELGKLENFKEGFTFEEYGKTISKYNVGVDMTVEREGHELRIIDNCYIREGTYTLGLTQDNKDILNGLTRIKYAPINIEGLCIHAANEDLEDVEIAYEPKADEGD